VITCCCEIPHFLKICMQFLLRKKALSCKDSRHLFAHARMHAHDMCQATQLGLANMQGVLISACFTTQVHHLRCKLEATCPLWRTYGACAGRGARFPLYAHRRFCRGVVDACLADCVASLSGERRVHVVTLHCNTLL